MHIYKTIETIFSRYSKLVLVKKIFTSVAIIFFFCLSATAQSVGIGTNTPSARLEVKGDLLVDATDITTNLLTVKANNYTTVTDQTNLVTGCSVGRGDRWQSFTVGVSGSLASIDVIVNTNIFASGYWYLYSGTGTGGTLLKSGLYTFSTSPGLSNYNILVNSPQLTAGQVYTFRMDEVTWSINCSTNTNPYPGGRASWDPSADFAFKTNMTLTTIKNHLVIAPNGNVGMGTATPAQLLDVAGTTKTSALQITAGAAGSYLLQSDAAGNASWVSPAALTGIGSSFTTNTVPKWNGTSFVSSQISELPAGNIGIGNILPQEKLDVGGRLRAFGYACRTGTAGIFGTNIFNFNWNGASLGMYIDNTFIGNVTTTSDRRLKDKIMPQETGGIPRLMALKPVSFFYKKVENSIFTGSTVQQEGFIADELQAVIPSAVNGDKNAVNAKGEIQPQTLNIIPVVSVLTKAMQEQQKMIEAMQKDVVEIKRLVTGSK